jgi:Flp pilus assembly protein TadG
MRQNPRKGSALLEFALTLPVLLLILLGIMEFASVFFVRHAILNAAGEASRSYAIGESTAGEAEALALAQLSAIGASFSATASPQSSSSVERWVEISVPISQAALGDPLNVLGDANLTVRVTMRREEE